MQNSNALVCMAVINATTWAASVREDSEGYMVMWLLFATFFVIKDWLVVRKMANSPK